MTLVSASLTQTSSEKMFSKSVFSMEIFMKPSRKPSIVCSRLRCKKHLKAKCPVAYWAFLELPSETTPNVKSHNSQKNFSKNPQIEMIWLTTNSLLQKTVQTFQSPSMRLQALLTQSPKRSSRLRCSRWA